MHSALLVLALLSLAVTAGILMTGIFSLFRGGEFNRRYSNKLMQARIISQAVTILLFIAWFTSGQP